MKKFLRIVLISFSICVLAFIGLLFIGFKGYISGYETTKTSIAKVTEVGAKETKYEFYINNNKYEGSFKGKDTFLAGKNDYISILYNKKKPEENCVKELYLYNRVNYYLAIVIMFILLLNFILIILFIRYFYKYKKEEPICEQKVIEYKVFNISNKFKMIIYFILIFVGILSCIVNIYLDGISFVSIFFFIWSIAWVPFFINSYKKI